MTFDQVCKALTRDPWHLSMPDIMELTPYQVRNVYFRSDRRDEPVSAYAHAKDTFFKMQREWYGKTDAEAEALWREEAARLKASPGAAGI